MYVEFKGVSMPGSVGRSLTWTPFEGKISNILPPFSDQYTQPCKAKILKHVGQVATGAGYRNPMFQTFMVRGSSNTNLSK